MSLPTALTWALKEWAIVCDALKDRRQMILLRKGGIYESAGEFELEHREFLLFPTYVHQKREMIKPAALGGFEQKREEPSEIVITSASVVTDIIQLRSRDQMNAIDNE